MKTNLLLPTLLITALVSTRALADSTIVTNYIQIGNKQVPELTIDGVTVSKTRRCSQMDYGTSTIRRGRSRRS